MNPFVETVTTLEPEDCMPLWQERDSQFSLHSLRQSQLDSEPDHFEMTPACTTALEKIERECYVCKTTDKARLIDSSGCICFDCYYSEKENNVTCPKCKMPCVFNPYTVLCVMCGEDKVCSECGIFLTHEEEEEFGAVCETCHNFRLFSLCTTCGKKHFDVCLGYSAHFNPCKECNVPEHAEQCMVCFAVCSLDKIHDLGNSKMCKTCIWK